MLRNGTRKALLMAWVAVSIALASACGTATTAQTPAAAEPPAAAETAPPPEPTAATQVETVMTSAEKGLIINEDTSRSALFNINTLAYKLPGMDAVEVLNITYAQHGNVPLTLDIYYPPGTQADAQLPVVVFGMGYRMSEQPLRNEHFYTSWGRLVAAAGMAAIVYDTEQPDQDLKILMTFIRQNAAALRVDASRIGLMSSSSNAPTVMSYLMQRSRGIGIQFSIYYFSHSLTPDRKYTEEFQEACDGRGCLISELKDVSYVDRDIPLFIVEAGQDFLPHINDGMNHFIEYVGSEGANVTFTYYEDGKHGFDTQTTEESAQIIAETVEFMQASFAKGNQALVLRNGTVITATGPDPIPNAAVVVENGLITAVGPESEIAFPDGATIVDVAGRTILPGLIDARASDLLNRLEIEEGRIETISLGVYLKDTLEAGVTTVRATGWERGDAQDVALLRAALVAHGNTVPTVVLVGPMLAHQDGSAADTYQDQTAGAATVNEARTTTERLIEAGFDQVGLVQSITQEARLGSHEGLPPVLSADQLQAIVEVAHNQGQWVLGQAVFPEEAQGMLTAGVDEIANWPSSAVPMPEEPIRALVQGSIPVVSGFNVVTPQAGDVRRFLDAGGTLVFGTYGPNAISLASPHKEFLVMQTQGMSATEMIQAATANAAQAIGLGDRVGTLEVGKQADMIVVDGDPLADFGVMEQVIYVVKGGELAVQPESD